MKSIKETIFESKQNEFLGLNQINEGSNSRKDITFDEFKSKTIKQIFDENPDFRLLNLSGSGVVSFTTETIIKDGDVFRLGELKRGAVTPKYKNLNQEKDFTNAHKRWSKYIDELKDVAIFLRK